MGRTKQYTDAAAKHRAYRARLAVETVRVDRRRWAALEGRANRLAEAVGQARAAGCEVAREIAGAATDTVLDSLVDLPAALRRWLPRLAQPNLGSTRCGGRRDPLPNSRTSAWQAGSPIVADREV